MDSRKLDFSLEGTKTSANWILDNFENEQHKDDLARFFFLPRRNTDGVSDYGNNEDDVG